MRSFFITFLSLFLSSLSAQQEISFLSMDSAVTITADLYFVKKDAPFILLCHQAGWSKGEYLETAPLLNELGYNCMAINQRSGDSINNVINTTAREAREKKLPVGYLNAENDIITAVNYLYKGYGQKIILIGSSYSSSLVLKIAAANPNVKAVAAFSPGEYFKVDKDLLKKSIKGLNKPTFITCSKEEIKETEIIAKAVDQKSLTFFKPTCAGEHGSRALWKEKPCHDAYWKALVGFLKTIK